MSSAHAACGGPKPREITSRVIHTLVERGQLERRAVPDTPVRPRTFWRPDQLRIYQVYAGSSREHGAKKRTAAELGITPAELSRQFREAEATLLEAYYVAGVLAPASTLRDPRAVHRCLDVYDEMTSGPRRLGHGPHAHLFWSRPPVDGRLAAGQRSLLKAAARSLVAEDLLYLNAAAAYGTEHDVRADVARAGDLYRLVAERDPRGAGSGAGPARAFQEQFAAALAQAEARLAELLQRAAPPSTRPPQES